MKKFALVLIALVASGCASSSKDVGSAYISPATYKNYSCEELVEEGNYIQSRVQELAQSLDTEATKDVAQTSAAFILVPFTAGLSLGILGALEGGDGPEAVEYARLKGEYEAVRQMMSRKKCKTR